MYLEGRIISAQAYHLANANSACSFYNIPVCPPPIWILQKNLSKPILPKLKTCLTDKMSRSRLGTDSRTDKPP
uniref:Uncharacterized protein n=1 Tax=Hyaloperonospora arabidopsidis (strain Emoy2) TaxID=559515 RepID=M4BK13_HYAAE